MKKWALQMRTLGSYVKHSAMIDGKENKGLSRAIFIILSLLFFGAFFVWFNDNATIAKSEELKATAQVIVNKFFTGAIPADSEIDQFVLVVKSLAGNLLRLMLVPLLTIILSYLLTIPYIYINVYENCDNSGEYIGKKLATNIFKGIGKQLLIVLALIIPVFLLTLFGGAKWFLNYGIFPTIIFALIYLITYFTMCFQIDPRETDEGADYPYDAVSKQVKTIIHARIKENEGASIQEQMKDINTIVSNIEQSITNDPEYVPPKKSPFKKACLLFKITWGRSGLVMMILQYIIPVIQMLLIYVLNLTHRDLVVYAGLGFFTAFAVMFEARVVTKLYTHLVHGVKEEELRQVKENDDSFDLD